MERSNIANKKGKRVTRGWYFRVVQKNWTIKHVEIDLNIDTSVGLLVHSFVSNFGNLGGSLGSLGQSLW